MLKASVHYDSAPAKLGRILKDIVKAIVPLNLFLTSTGNGADQTEDVLATYSIPAATMGANGVQGFEIEAWGTTGASGDNKTIKLYFGSAVMTSGVLTPNAKNWHAKMTVWRTSLNNQVVVGEMIVDVTDIAPTVTTATETETAAIVAKCTGQNTSNSTANSVIVKAFSVRSIEQKN